MKNKFANIFLISSLILYVAISVIAIVLSLEYEFYNVSFFISLGALVVPNIPISIIIGKKLRNIFKSDVVTIPNLLITFLVANILLVIAGAICTYFNILAITISVDIAIYAVYVILLMQYFAVGAFITKNDERNAKKVLFKREITDLIKAYSYVAKDASLKNELIKLSNNLRYSDPMSNSALEQDEKDILSKAYALKELVNVNDEEAKSVVAEIDILLKLRNDKCARLK